MLTCKPSRARSVIRVAPGDAGPAVMSPWVSCTDRLSIKAYGPGKSARGWKLDVGEGLSPVAPCRSILEAPNPARVQHVDQLLCREVYKNRHWASCAIEPRHPPVGAKLQQANIGANGEEVRCDTIGCTADALCDDKIGHRPAQLFGQITAKLEAGDRLDAPLSCQGSCEHVAQQG